MKIIKAESLDTKLGKKKYFKGDVWLEDISREAPDTRLILVYFAPKSRTYWHKHSEAEQIAGEQILYVIAGKGRVKREEDEKGYEIYPGDVVYIAEGEKHWHGAAPDSFMVHIAGNYSGQNDLTKK